MSTIFPAVSLPAFDLADALESVDRAESPAERLKAAADALHAFGFQRVVATLRDASFTATMVVTAGEDKRDGALDPLPGAVWRRRVSAIERYRVGDLYLLDGNDQWVAREFFGKDATPRADDARTWLPTDLILGFLRGLEGEVIGVVKMARPLDGRRPTESRQREIGWLLRHTASRLCHDTLSALAQRRAERLQRLQETGAALARSLDEGEIVRELARQAIRATSADGALLAFPDLDKDELITAYRLIGADESPRAPMALGNGVIAEVARTGRPFRVGDRDADRAHQRRESTCQMPSLLDVVDETAKSPSILAVPLLVGIRLVGVLVVHATTANVFSAEDEEVLATMASQAATAIANARRYAESERERRQTEALADVARAVGESLRQGEVLRLILRHALSLLRAEGACIALRADEYMHIVAGVGAAEVLAGVHLPVASSLLGHAVTTGELVISNEFNENPNSSKTVRRLARIDRALIAPLVTARGTIGAISVLNRDQAFTDEDARVLKRLSDQVSVAIVNARLFEEVERATREWKVAFDAIASGMVVLDDRGVVQRCNARAADLTNRRSVSELLGQSFPVALLGDDFKDSGIEDLLVDGRGNGETVRATVRDEEHGRLIDLTVAPHPDGGSVVTFDDVTEMNGLAERHRRVLEMASEAIIITDTNRRVAYANPAAHTLFSRDDLVGAPTIELIPPEAHESLASAESAAMSGQVQRYELPIVRADGQIRQVAISSAPLLEVGQITGTVACLRDVTDTRADAIALARSEARYTRLVESASDAIFTIDADGCFTSVNRSMVEATGLTREDLLGQSCLVMVDPRDRTIAQEALNAVVRGERHKVQLRYFGPHGSIRVGALLVAPITDEDAFVGGLGVVRDITDEELARGARTQEDQLASMGRVLGSLANELNNPLSSLLAVAELHAASTTLSTHDRVALIQIREEARRASRIVKHLLGVSVGASGERTTVQLNRLVRETLDVHGYTLREKQIPVRLDLSTRDPSVRGNPAKLQQVLVNLIKNAEEALADASGPREVLLQTVVSGGRASIVVSDTGCGIPEENLARVFEPMFTTRTDNQMRGLGLAVASAVIADHGGTIHASSNGGAGARFTISLPVVMQASDFNAPLHSISGTSVLVVEDEATLRSAVQRFLVRQGLTVTVAENGEEALNALDVRSYDIILLDLRMLGMQGDEVYRRIEERDAKQAERVIFMTGDLHNSDIADFVARSGRSALAKPFQLAELVERIEAELSSRKQ